LAPPDLDPNAPGEDAVALDPLDWQLFHVRQYSERVFVLVRALLRVVLGATQEDRRGPRTTSASTLISDLDALMAAIS
jgi:hypothetical protein